MVRSGVRRDYFRGGEVHVKRGTRVKIVSPGSQFNGMRGVVTGRSGIGKRVFVLLDASINAQRTNVHIEFFPSELKQTRSSNVIAK